MTATRSPLALALALALAPACVGPEPQAEPGPAPQGRDTASEVGASCFPADPEALPLAGADREMAAGEFLVAVDEEGRLAIRHASAPTRTLFESAATPLAAARVDLGFEEHQGSFEMRETVEVECVRPRLDEVRGGDGSVALAGGFDDDGAACSALGWRLLLCEERPGHLAFQLSTSDPSFDRVTLRVASDAGERIWGMGEQFPHDRLDLKGRAIPVLSQEGGVGRGHAPITPAVDAASPGSGGSEDSTYYAAPHYVTSRLRSVFLEDTEPAIFDFRASDVIEIRLEASTMTGRVLYGQSPLELIERFTEYAGRMPPLPAWVNEGAIVGLARDLDESRAIVDRLRARGARIAGVWNQTWSGRVRTYIGEQVLWNWVQGEATHPGWQGFVSDLEADGIRTLCYVNPMFVDTPAEAGPVARNLFAEGLAGGYFVHRADGSPYLMPVTAFDVGLLDLTNPDARDWMRSIIRDEILGNGRCSGWMVDFGEALPFDAALHSGESAAAYHNDYPVEWMRLNREAIEEAGATGEVVTFNRSGAARTPAYSLLLWQGDQLTTWDKYDGLVSALHGLISSGFSGIALNHSDTGGYTSLSLDGLVGYDREREQLYRWTEMNAFTAVLRTHEGNQPEANAQVYSDDEAMDHFARFTRVYAALAFYRARLFDEATDRGWPLVRHLFLHAPEDPTAQTIDEEFLLGSEILVAPILNKCWTWPVCDYDKEVYLPAGEWVHLWSGRVFGRQGEGSWVAVQAPIGEPAVFYRRGSEVGSTFVANLRAEGIDVADPPE